MIKDYTLLTMTPFQFSVKKFDQNLAKILKKEVWYNAA